MKGFALVLLCALVAVQARHTSLVQSGNKDVAQLSPWTVHLRIAIGTSGLLETCVATLINENWALTVSGCVDDVRFIWARFGVVDVMSPALVYELGLANTYPSDPADLNSPALLAIVRGASEDGIAPVGLTLPGADVPSSAVYCSFGEDDSGAPGAALSCVSVSVEAGDDSLVVDLASTSKFDIGAGLVADDNLVGFLSGDGAFAPVSNYVEWIEATSGVSFSPESGDADADDSDAFRVHFVN